MFPETAGIARLRNVLTRSISAENPTGEPGGGAREAVSLPALLAYYEKNGPGSPARELGLGWKTNSAAMVAAGETLDLARIGTAGVITHIWLTTSLQINWRRFILRAYWDGDDQPAIEVPLGDFFAQGTAVSSDVFSAPIAVLPLTGFNSYWPMPFRSGARITIENLDTVDHWIAYEITYEVGGDVSDSGYLHAQFRRNNPVEYGETHVLVEDIEGHGQYVGTYLSWGSHEEGWWGEGEVKFYLDDDGEFPTICGSGTEDYFGGAMAFLDDFNAKPAHYRTFSTAYLGMPQVIRPDGLFASQTRFSLYRWHIPDPIHFARRLGKVEVQVLGIKPGGGLYNPRRDDVASTALFYLDRTSATRRPLPGLHDLDMVDGSKLGG